MTLEHGESYEPITIEMPPGHICGAEAYRQNQARAAADAQPLVQPHHGGYPDSQHARPPIVEPLTNETLRVWIRRWCGGDTRLPHISTWDTSQVTDMRGLFGRTALNENDDVEDTSCVLLADLPLFNDDISAWDTSSVTTMDKMFKGQSAFNRPLGAWRVHNVTNMRHMFDGASAFNQPLGDWQVDKVEDMMSMFSGASSFNHPIGGWRVHNVWNMRAMFFGAASFNQPLGDWRVHRVLDMKWMFKDARSFNQPLGGWWVQQVRTMQAMFQGAESMVEPNVLYSAFKWFQPTRGRLADQWWADKEEMEKDKERPRWQLGDPTPVQVSSDARFTGVVVACEVREVELSDENLRFIVATVPDGEDRRNRLRRRFYFVQGEDGDNVLLHEASLVQLGEFLAVGDRISYAVGPSRFNAVYTHYRLECADVARAPRPDPPDASSICAAVVLLGVLMAYDQYFKSK